MRQHHVVVVVVVIVIVVVAVVVAVVIVVVVNISPASSLLSHLTVIGVDYLYSVRTL